MEFFLDLLKDVFRGAVRAISSYVFHKFLFKNEKTTRRRSKQMGGSHKNKM